jgi:hypothetical protein
MITKIYSKLLDTSDYTIFDSRSINWGNFEFTNGYKKHFITQDQILKPYLISLGYYNVIDYEDEILLINNIADLYEVVVGTEIKIPDINDLKQFILNNSK